MDRRTFLAISGILLAGCTSSKSIGRALTHNEKLERIEQVAKSVHYVKFENKVTINVDKLAHDYLMDYCQLREQYMKRMGNISRHDLKELVDSNFKKRFVDFYGTPPIPEGTSVEGFKNFLIDFFRQAYGIDLTKQFLQTAQGSCVVLKGKEPSKLYLLTASHVYETGELNKTVDDPKSGIKVPYELPVIVQEVSVDIDNQKANIHLQQAVINNPSLDYALLEVPGSLALKPFPFEFAAIDTLRVGDEVHVFGYPPPFGSALYRSGKISLKHVRFTDESWFITSPLFQSNRSAVLFLDVEIESGDSGGLFVDKNLNFGGLVLGKPMKGPRGTFAVNIEAMLKDGLADYIHPSYLPRN